MMEIGNCREDRVVTGSAGINKVRVVAIFQLAYSDQIALRV
jgi:hypothetical protein